MRCMNCMQPVPDHAAICPNCGYDIANASTVSQFLQPGTRLRHYELGRVLGAGGFGVTYLAWDENLRRRVAIKEFFPSGLSTRVPNQNEITSFTGEKQLIYEHGLQRFVEEAQLLLQFGGYEGIVSVYDVFEENNTAYMVMEYIEGVTLKKSIEQFGKMEEQQLLDCMIPMLLTLKFVHQMGYIHRDISPDNIMCLPDGTVKLLDFGSARYALMAESQSLSVIVKQGFTPIEQYQAHGKQGPWTDVYAVGATMYAALTGVVPAESLDRLADDTLPAPSQLGVEVSANTQAAIMSALNVQPEDRPQDLDAFLAILTGSEQGNVVRQKKKKRLSPSAIVAIVLAAVVGIAGIGAGIWNLMAKPPEPEEYTEVPGIVGKQTEEASALLSARDLALRITGGQYYDEELVELGFVSAGQIMKQDPDSGEKIEVYGTVDAEVSKGKKQIYIPTVTDKLLERVKDELKQAGVTGKNQIEIVEQYSSTNLPGTVISQSIPADQGVDYDTPITIVISLGPETPPAPTPEPQAYILGDCTGKDFDQVKAELLAEGIYCVKSATVYSPDVPFNAIVSQNPAPGTELCSGDAVFVVVSLGQEQARVPDVTYMPLGLAKDTLAACGLSWSAVYVEAPLVAQGHVAAQKITPGEQVPFGTAVALEVSSGGTPSADEYPTPDSISLEPESLSMLVLEQADLTLSYTGSDPVLWSSTNPSSASVDETGRVCANWFGSATIIASAGGNVAFSSVLVEDPNTAPTRLMQIVQVGDVVDASLALPSDIRGHVVWRSSSPSVATVDQNGKVEAIAPGFALIVGSNDGTLTCISLTVEENVHYLEFPRTALERSATAAEEALKAEGVSCSIQWEYDDAPWGSVLRIDYTGHIDRENYYILEDTPVTIYASASRPSAKLALKSAPSKLVYYLGDTLDTTGLVLTYTDVNGKTSDVTTGFTTGALAWQEGTQTIPVTYQNQQVFFDVTVKTPSVKLTKESSEQGLYFYVTTDPASQPVHWYTSDPEIAYFEGDQIIPVSSGTVTITVTMIYNGKEYSDSVPLTVEMQQEEYYFNILHDDYNYYANMVTSEYRVETNIPGFLIADVEWSISPSDRYDAHVTERYTYRAYDRNGHMKDGESYTVTATYVYNGKTYSANYVFVYHENNDG